MDQKIYNKTITIMEIGTKQVQGGSRYSLKDHEGKTFSFFTTKKDGTDTSVFAQFKTMELAVGSTVMLGYVEDEFTKDGKTIISKKIINFRETNDIPIQIAPQGKSSNLGHSGASGRPTAVGRNYDQEGYEKCAWSYFTSVCNGDLEAFGKALVSSEVYDAFQAIKFDSAKRFSVGATNLNPDLPTIHMDDDYPNPRHGDSHDVDVEGISF